MTVKLGSLALHGGAPIRATMLPYGRQLVADDDIAAVVRVLRSDWLTTGPDIAAFEREFAEFVGVRHAVAVSSGTAALHAATFAAGIQPGAEVIVPAMTFVASANCVRYQGGTVVFGDICPDTLNLAPSEVERLLTPRTKAIVTVDYGGQPSDLAELGALAAKHDLALIEDASHALGASYRGQPVGSISTVTTFSLHPVKQMTTGEGGMLTTNDGELAATARMFRNHGITTDAREREAQSSWLYQMSALGYNYRLTDFQCALGRAQLTKVPAWLRRRREIAEKYNASFADLREIETPTVRPDREPAWHLYHIRLVLSRLSVNREVIFQALRAENIGVNVHYIPVPWHEYYQALGYRKGQWPSAEGVYARLITLPLWAGMTDHDVNDVIGAVRKVCEAHSL